MCNQFVPIYCMHIFCNYGGLRISFERPRTWTWAHKTFFYTLSWGQADAMVLGAAWANKPFGKPERMETKMKKYVERYDRTSQGRHSFWLSQTSSDGRRGRHCNATDHIWSLCPVQEECHPRSLMELWWPFTPLHWWFTPCNVHVNVCTTVHDIHPQTLIEAAFLPSAAYGCMW